MTDDFAKAIAADYAAKDRAVERERQEHLAAGKPISTFTPTQLID